MNKDQEADLVTKLRELADAIENGWVTPTWLSKGIDEAGHSVLHLNYLPVSVAVTRLPKRKS